MHAHAVPVPYLLRRTTTNSPIVPLPQTHPLACAPASFIAVVA